MKFDIYFWVGFFSCTAVSAHRSIGLVVSNKRTKATQNDAKSSLSGRSQITKSSSIQPKRNVVRLKLLNVIVYEYFWELNDD